MSEWTTVKYKKQKAKKSNTNYYSQPTVNESTQNDFQDWDTQVIQRRQPTRPKLSQSHLREGQYVSLNKGIQNKATNYDAQRMRKLDQEDETFRHKKVDRRFSLKVQQARLVRKLTQKQLAQKLNLPVDVITKYENGTAINDGQVTGKLKQFLHI